MKLYCVTRSDVIGYHAVRMAGEGQSELCGSRSTALDLFAF